MKRFKKVVVEANFAISFILFFNTLLNSIILLLLFSIPCLLLDIPYVLGLVGAAVYFVAGMRDNMSENKFAIIEEKYPELYEKLRTAADYSKVENEVVNSLHSDVSQIMRKVRSAVFVNARGTTLKIMAIVILCFVLLFISSLPMRFFSIKTVPEIIFRDGGPKYTDRGTPDALVLGGGIVPDVFPGDEDIYGDSSIAMLGDNAINVEIQPKGMEINVRNYEDAEKKEFEELFPDEIFKPKSGKLFDEKIAIENQELVKNYFMDIASKE